MSHSTQIGESKSGSSTRDTEYQVFVDLMMPDYTSTKHAVRVNKSMTILSLKNLFFETFNTRKFTLIFAEIFFDSARNDIDDKPISFFLLKEGSVVKLHRSDIEYSSVSSIPPPPPPPILHRQIGTCKWKSGHRLAYIINKPVQVQIGLGYLYIVTPNGTKFEGEIEETNKRFYEAGFTVESLASEQEITDALYIEVDCFYNLV